MFLGVGLIAILFAQPARAATVLVTNTLDSGPGSLRQAVLDAVPNDTVIFSQDVFSIPQTIALTSGQIEISKSLTIDGADAVVSVSNNCCSDFYVNEGAELTLDRLRLTNSYPTAIQNHGMITVSNSIFENNTSACRVCSDFGGPGILNTGKAVVMNSTFVSNTVFGGNGGAITNFGTLSIINSTFTGNVALSYYWWDYGANGGAIANYGALSIVNSTISGNKADMSGAGIYNVGIVTLTNSIIANSVTSGNCSGIFVDGGYNLEDANTCGFSPTLHSLISTTAMLGPLQVNPPGLAIATMALLFGSPAINAGDDAACPPTDGRGVHRPIGPHCDIGAYEAPNMVWLLQVMRHDKTVNAQ